MGNERGPAQSGSAQCKARDLSKEETQAMNEKLKILEMLDQGTITVEEANQLLEAAQDNAGQASQDTPDTPAAVSPDMQRFRHLSYIPFGVSMLLLLLLGWGTYALSRKADGRITAGFVALVILLAIVFFTTLLAFAMTRVPWLHVRIQSKSKAKSGEQGSQRKFIISLPVPLSLAQWGLHIAHRYVGEERAADLDAAAALLKTVKHDLGKPGTDPIMVDVDDADERVQVYIG
jgi:hypothetical protein